MISVILPIYNGEKTVEKAIYSVLNQSYKDIEIIAIDDCSKDRTYIILCELSKKDSRVHVFKNKKNLGVAKTRNKGIEQASGEYIAFIDGDDCWSSNKIEKQISVLKNKNADLCYTASKIIDENNNVLNFHKHVPTGISYKGLLKENVIVCSSIVLKREVLPKNPFDGKYFHEDFVLWLRLLKNGYKAIGIDDALVTYRLGGRSADKKNAIKYRWKIYRQDQNLGFFTSLWYFLFYIFTGIRNILRLRNKN
ncbi:MAG: glycosyltransferase [Clostridia bacterium]|jgi:teichuronic acid biosynthesis glycosyltransferase TuaG|nr:glycosyltransferase [Clostridia bacterium]MCI2000569.1 glycosyltransferase [Clostridia bacterium]MCI2015025.1 glycosyltransferase [Clostridia bacterium]